MFLSVENWGVNIVGHVYQAMAVFLDQLLYQFASRYFLEKVKNSKRKHVNNVLGLSGKSSPVCSG